MPYKDPEKQKAMIKEWRKNNPKKTKEYSQRHRETHKEQLNARAQRKQRERYASDAEYRIANIARARKFQADRPIWNWANNSVQNHRKRGFNILFKAKDLEATAINITHCPICGVEFDYGPKGHHGQTANTPTMDRVDNTIKIVTLKDIQIICSVCNIKKGNKVIHHKA